MYQNDICIYIGNIEDGKKLTYKVYDKINSGRYIFNS